MWILFLGEWFQDEWEKWDKNRKKGDAAQGWLVHITVGMCTILLMVFSEMGLSHQWPASIHLLDINSPIFCVTPYYFAIQCLWTRGALDKASGRGQRSEVKCIHVPLLKIHVEMAAAFLTGVRGEVKWLEMALGDDRFLPKILLSLKLLLWGQNYAVFGSSWLK